MNEAMIKRLEALPCPVLALTEKGSILYRNRLAKCLLPSRARLRGLLAVREETRERFLFEMRIDEIAYLVLTMKEEENVELLCFFENFLPLQEGISRVIFEKMQDFFWVLMNHREEAGEGKVLLPDQLSARIGALQASTEHYLRLLDAQSTFSEEKTLCSLDGFFRYLKRALDVRGIGTDFRFPRKTSVVSEGSVLSYLVLNLLCFVRVYEDDKDVVLKVKEEGERLRFSVEFSDRGDVAASFENLVRRGFADEKLLSVLPLLCILRVCLERGIPWLAQQNDDYFAFSFLMEKGIGAPVSFLSDATAKEVSDLIQMVKTIFS